jgi:hypothetical protein
MQIIAAESAMLDGDVTLLFGRRDLLSRRA